MADLEYILSLMKNRILLTFLSVVFFNKFSLADNFKDALDSVRAEAVAQQKYFHGLSQEYYEEAISTLGNDKILKNALLKNPVGMDIYDGYCHALDSYYFWSALKHVSDLMATEYDKLLGENKSQSLPIQWALGFWLEQVSRAGAIAYSDISSEMQVMILSGHKLKDKGKYQQVVQILNYVTALNLKRPDSHSHMSLKLEQIKSTLKLEFGDKKLYRQFFIDFQAMHCLFNTLRPFYVLETPISAQQPTDLTSLNDKWVDLIAKEVSLRFKRDTLRKVSMLTIDQRADEIKIMLKLLDLFEPIFRDKVKRALDNQKKRLKAKEKNRLAQAEVQAENNDLAVEILNTPKPPIDLEQKEERSVSLSEVEEKSQSDEDLGEDNMPSISYVDWVETQRRLSLAKKQVGKDSFKETPKDLPTVFLSGGAEKIYRSAMGLGSFATTNRDLKDFLRQVGGSFVKCSGPHSDPKIALPNFSQEFNEKFLIDKMHLMHSGREIFPISRLQIHLKRMIERAGLSAVVELDS